MKKSSLLILIAAALLLIVLGAWYAMRTPAPQPAAPQPTPAQAPPPGHPVVGLGEHCGGNMTTAPVCAAGFHCAPTPGSHLPFGDVGGTCVAD